MLSSSEVGQGRFGGMPFARRRGLRRAVFTLADTILLSAATVLAFLLALRVADERISWPVIAVAVGLSLASKLPVLQRAGVYNVHWAHVDAGEMVMLARALTFGSAIFIVSVLALHFAAGWPALPARLLVLDFMAAVLMVAGSRAAFRAWRERRFSRARASARNMLIVGAGDAGMQVVWALRHEVGAQHQPIGFVDDDPAKQGLTIGGVRVIGTRQDLPEIARRYNVNEMWVAMPSARGSVIGETIRLARAAGFRQIKVVPGLSALLTGQVKLTDIRDVQIEELLGRDPVRIDTGEVSAVLRGRRVLVTGGAGSIGSELCRQIGRFDPELLVVLDQDETGVFNVMRSLGSVTPGVHAEAVVGDVRDAEAISRVFERFRPDVVFHAAAYKHVPLMEDHPDQAIRTNVFGTRAVAEAALRWGASRFVLISTDKAVNPTSIMGATKRASEVLVQQMGRNGKTSFVAVRFGNVLGSRGSVVPIFREQIAQGGPVTITDPEMTRYFMTIQEAVLLVLQAGAMGEDGQVMVLDMGDPVKIIDLARQMITLSGLEPDRDIPIVCTGIRPGEKLFEDILSAEEGTTATRHSRVFIARVNPGLTPQEVQERLAALERTVAGGDREQIVAALRRLVSTYTPPGLTQVARIPAAANGNMSTVAVAGELSA